ncbi:MAG TPA: response regulator transcription factor [Candidatus Obscuribacterales bacterium]
MAKILFLEDEHEVAFVVCEALEGDRHEVKHVTHGQDALRELSEFQYDLLLLDWRVPDVSGIDVLKHYRARGGKAPALILTGKEEVDAKVEGLMGGADDYVTKPFDLRELCARVQALLRRAAGHATNVLTIGPIALDPVSYRVECSGRPVRLAPREFALLEFLMRHPDQVFSQEDLLNRVWHSDADVSPETVRTCMKRLRQKLGMDKQNSMLQTLPRIGYKLEPPP